MCAKPHATRGLVDYATSGSESGSDDDAGVEPPRSQHDDDGNGVTTKPAPTSIVTPSTGTRKRRLPPLGDDLTPLSAAQEAGPSKRVKAVVAGEWLCHVFVEVPQQISLDRTIDRCHRDAREAFATRFQPIGSRPPDPANGGHPGEVTCERPHISLTRPILLRAHERTMFVQEAAQAVRAASHAFNMQRFPVSFSRLDHLVNDDRTRDFLVLEVGAGWKELKALAESLSTALYRLVRAKPYYEEARFHASVGFVSMVDDIIGDEGHSMPSQPAPAAESAPDGQGASAAAAEAAAEAPAVVGPRPRGDAEDTRAAEIRRCPPFLVDRIGIRVGKQVTWVDLRQ
ncbi:uncharacterized protein PFL1_05850 [Pseudozyma flocculosa PF-1]|uniref:U6 snRNA phosphodiesterase 1 n=2 Tax=Pseudozyma flocculosa TaxID=84751 RepID=A0A5C3F5G1_9BASI|nr:uncharacterized protein PFL1_05850 [Pseudozyma flocculosa PF-1]EPQ26528.1 hypothetical protein PFL1_05850 [Pseudozyma flocculosa PF-1]SPO38481.1 uncharacterized protein PSFLO_03959 [Pseudozyma flocculosa]